VEVEHALESSDKALTAVTEPTMYPSDFPILLRERFKGHTAAYVATVLQVPEEHVHKLLDGQWRPTKGICQRMGLKRVYAIAQHGAVSQRSTSGSPDAS
jgi:hypothetical protein